MSLVLNARPMGDVDESLLNEVKAFTDSVVRPGAEEWEADHVQPGAVREAISKFTKYYIPKEYGGEKTSAMTLSCMLEEMSYGDYAFTFAYQVHNAATCLVSGSPNTALRNQYLPRMMRGEMIGAFLLTEPSAGSDAASIQTTAVYQNGKWILNGEKAWITNAASADLMVVFAQAGVGSKGIIGFCVERNDPGVETTEVYNMVGAHAAATGAIRFKDCAIGEDRILYSQGEAFHAALGGIDFARFAVASMCNGALRCCLETAIDYAKERIQFKAPIYQNQGVQFKLMDAVTNLEASRLLTYQVAQKFDNGEKATIMAAHCKKFASLNAFEGATCAMQCMGSNGLKRTYPIVRQLTTIAISFNTDGTNDICNVVLGRAL